MTYALARSLQVAVFDALSNDVTLSGIVGSAVYDALPSGALPPIYVTLGQETARDQSDQTDNGAEHDFVVSVLTENAGFSGAKEAAAVISDILVDADLILTRGRLISLSFSKAKASRIGTGDERRIDLTFRARVEDV